MSLKDQLKKGRDALLQTGAELVKEGTEKLQDKEFREETAKKVVDTAAKITRMTAKAASDAALSTYEFAQANRLLPGAKEAYIRQLEDELVSKDREIARLKKELKRHRWGRR